MKSWTTKNGCRVVRLLNGRSNVYLISGNEQVILVDTSPGRLWKKLKRRLKKLGIESLDYLVLTHAHFDHAANAERIKKEYRAKVIINAIEAPLLEKGENAMIKGTNPFTRRLVNLLAPALLKKLNYEPCIPDIVADQDFPPDTAGIRCRIVHTPGHTTGSQSVIVDEEIAIVGDAMFGIFRNSIFPPYAFDACEMARSWGKLLNTGCTIFLPSHGTENARELVKWEYEKRSRE